MIRLPHLIGAAVILAAALWLGSYVPALGVIFLVALLPILLRARYPRSLQAMWRNEYPAETSAQRLRRSIADRETERHERRHLRR